MSGCRDLKDNEINLVLLNLKSNRDKTLFILGLKTGFRVSELLSLRIADVYQHGQVINRIKVYKRNMKGKTKSREVLLHPMAKNALQALIGDLKGIPESSPLFISRNKNEGSFKPITRFQAHVLLKEAYKKAGLIGSLATHTMRKTFARNIHARLQYDILKTQHALGHASILSTVKYLPVDQDDIDKAIGEG